MNSEIVESALAPLLPVQVGPLFPFTAAHRASVVQAINELVENGESPKIRLMAIRAAIDCEKINAAAQVEPQAVVMLAPIEKKPFMSIEQFRALPLDERIRILRDNTTSINDRPLPTQASDRFGEAVEILDTARARMTGDNNGPRAIG